MKTIFTARFFINRKILANSTDIPNSLICQGVDFSRRKSTVVDADVVDEALEVVKALVPAKWLRGSQQTRRGLV